MNEFLDPILDRIIGHECILVLGPRFGAKADNTPLHIDMKTHFEREKQLNLDYELENLYILKTAQPTARSKFYRSLKEYYTKVAPSKVYQQIAQLKFDLVINVSPDLLLKNAYDTVGADVDFEYYDKAGKVRAKLPPTEDRPYLYNLFGNIANDLSLILTYDDLYDFVKALMSDETSLHEKLYARIFSGTAILFLGFDMEKWYIKLLLKKLDFGRDYPRLRWCVVSESDISSSETRDFLESNFGMEVMNEGATEFIDALFKRAEERERGGEQGSLLRPLKNATENSAVRQIKDYVRNTDLQAAIDLLTEEYDKYEDESNDMLVLAGGFAQLQKKASKGILTNEQIDTQTAQFSERILYFASQLDSLS
ncbi:MAG: hypothetical protein RI894_1092 [Bacteroidota bacterium]